MALGLLTTTARRLWDGVDRKLLNYPTHNQAFRNEHASSHLLRRKKSPLAAERDADRG